jgi:hypothetical protein
MLAREWVKDLESALKLSVGSFKVRVRGER